MAQREQHGNKESKKPKQDKKGGKPVSPLAATHSIITVIPDKGKKKNKA